MARYSLLGIIRSTYFLFANTVVSLRSLAVFFFIFILESRLVPNFDLLLGTNAIGNYGSCVRVIPEHQYHRDAEEAFKPRR